MINFWHIYNKKIKMNHYYMIQCLNRNKLAISSCPFVPTTDTDNAILYQLLTDLNFSLIDRLNNELKFRIIRVKNVTKSRVFSFCISKLENNYLENYDEIDIKTYNPFTLIVDNIDSKEVRTNFKIDDINVEIMFNVFKYNDKDGSQNNENNLDKIYLCNPSFKI